MAQKTVLEFPRSVREAAERLAGDLDDKEKKVIAKLSDPEIHYLHSGLGRKARNTFGMWTGNDALLADCARIMGKPNMKVDPQDASTPILFELRKVCRGF